VVKHDNFVKEEFDDTNGVNRNHKSKDRQPNGRKSKDRQYNGRKSKDRQYNGRKEKNDKQCSTKHYLENCFVILT
jgi:hypothetical protein